MYNRENVPGLVESRRPAKARDLRRLASLWRRVWRARGGVVGGLILLGAVGLAVAGPYLVPYDPIAVDLENALLPPYWQASGSMAHPLGTDHLGRDMMARLLYAGRVSLAIGLMAVFIGGGLGIFLGVAAGYRGAMLDAAIMRAADVQQSFPLLALAITIVAVLGPSTRNLIITLGIGGWVLFARVARAEALRVREEVYVEAARVIGGSDAHIIVRHVLPNIASPCIVVASFTFALMIITEAALSFVGMGVPPPLPSWGTMLYDARNYLELYWWLPTLPGLAIMVTVLSVNMVGDWLRDALDPRLRIL